MNISPSQIWRKSIIRDSARLLSKQDQRKVILVIALQICFGFLDLLGVMFIGVIGSLAITGVSSGKPGNRVSAVLKLLGLDNSPIQIQVATIGLIAATLLIGKTIFSVYFSRRVLFFLSRRGAAISARMVGKLLRQSLLIVQSRSLQTNLYSLTHGISLITVGVLGVFVSLVSDLSLLLVMILGLFAVDSAMALGTIVAFSGIAYTLWKLMHVRMRNLGLENAEISVKSSETIFEVLMAYREATVRNRRGYYASLIGKQRHDLANLQAEMSFMPNISKYVIEIAVVISAVAISGYQFLVNDASRAVAVLSIFLAATTRIAPAVLRIQQGAVSMKGTIASAQPTLDLIQELGWEEESLDTWKEPDFTYDGFKSEIELSGLSFSYPNSDKVVIRNVSVNIKAGSSFAFVGPSGAGKTTLVDLILGVLKPDKGSVKISGLDPISAIKKFPGAIAYVPQDVVVVNGSIRENVCLGFNSGEIPEDRIWKALRVAELEQHVIALDNGLDTNVGDRGTKLSGGQRQRLGIARAMLTNPKLLVLDEATSSLDGVVEATISESIQKMRGEVTILMIAHRLSTVRNCDQIMYLDPMGRTFTGTFEEVRSEIPDFDKQAKLMGL